MAWCWRLGQKGTLVPAHDQLSLRTLVRVRRDQQPTIGPESPPPTTDIAALVAHLRRDVEQAVQSERTAAGTVEGRFLRRLAGALSAYEMAHEILACAEGPVPVSSGKAPALTRQPCPVCDSSEFEAVSGEWSVHVVCRRCGTCSRPGLRALVLTDPDSCPGCDLTDRCTNRALQR